MNYELLPAQKQFMEIPHNYPRDIALYQGGFGSGKTFCGSLLGLLLAQKYPRIRGLVGALTFPLVRDTTLQSYFEHIEAMGLISGYDYVYKKNEEKLIFSNGSEILFRHLEEPNKLKSLNLGFIELEEMSDVPESTFKMLLGRLRQAKQPSWGNFQYRLFGHTNPEATKGWIYKYFVEQKAKNPNYRFIQAPTTQNTFLSPDFVESLKSAYDEEYYRINVLGEFGDYSSGLIVKGFNDENIKNIVYQTDMDLHITCDFNVDPMCWIVAHKTEDKIFFIDEIIIENTTTEQATKEFLRRYPNHKGKIIINGDAAGDFRSTQSELSNYIIMKNVISKHYPNKVIEIAVRNFNPRIKNRVAAFNAKIKDYNGKRCIYVDPKCEKLLYNVYNLKYKQGTDTIDIPTFAQLKTSRESKFLMHPFDAASYLVDYYFPIKREEFDPCQT